MNWYYAQAGQRQGPVDEARFRELLNRGEIAGDTLIWHEGMANWQMLREVHPELASPPFAPPHHQSDLIPRRASANRGNGHVWRVPQDFPRG